MQTTTPFHPATDAFAFDNSWPIDGAELEEIRSFLARERSGLVRALANSRLARLIVRQVQRRHLLDGLLSDEHLTSYGLCGGMAFAALDYYERGWVVPQGAGPKDHPMLESRAGRALRNYIWRRLLDSMQSRAAATMLLWSLALHLIPRLGPAWVLARPKQEWTSLKRHLDAGSPWPIGLVGMARGSFANHQVLALGYADAGDGTGSIAVYDSCCPASAHTITLDFRGRSLAADESCARGGGDTQWKGFFCDVYTPAKPPIAVGLSAGITASAAGDGASATLHYTARNFSFSQCPALALRLGRTAVSPGQTVDAGGEQEPSPLAAGACRTLIQPVTGDGAVDPEHFCARCSLGTVDGAEIWKRLPLHASAGRDSGARKPERRRRHGGRP